MFEFHNDISFIKQFKTIYNDEKDEFVHRLSCILKQNDDCRSDTHILPTANTLFEYLIDDDRDINKLCYDENSTKLINSIRSFYKDKIERLSSANAYLKNFNTYLKAFIDEYNKAFLELNVLPRICFINDKKPTIHVIELRYHEENNIEALYLNTGLLPLTITRDNGRFRFDDMLYWNDSLTEAWDNLFREAKRNGCFEYDRYW